MGILTQEVDDRTRLILVKHLSYSSCSINSSSTSGVVLDSESEVEDTKPSGKLSFYASESESPHDREEDIQRLASSVSALTNKQKIMVIGMLFANFCIGANYSLLGPFFPRQAEKKGFTPTQYCLVFGVFQLTAFLVSPVIGRMMPPLTPKFCLTAGAFINGCCTALFGLLHWCPGDSRFLTVAFIIEIVQAVGSGAVFTSSYTLVSSEFSDRASLFFSSVEASYGVGQGVGPIAGGSLHEAGGFFLPYTVMGSLTILISGILVLIFPKGSSNVSESKVTMSKDKKSLMGSSILTLSFFINMMVIVMAFLLMCFLDATLEPHIRQFNLPPRILGLVFPITGAVYALTAPLWGFICGKLNNPCKVSLMGCCLCGVGYTLIGPQPFIPVKSKLWLVILGQLCLGGGAGGGMIGSFVRCIKEHANGNAPDVSTYAVISGATSSAVALGSFIGPCIGGPLVESIGFKGGTLVLLGIIIIMTIILAIHMLFEANPQEKEEDIHKTCLARPSSKQFQDSLLFVPSSKAVNLITRSWEWPRFQRPSSWQYSSV